MLPSQKLNLEMTASEKQHIDNLITLLAKATTELKGIEVIAAADAMRWLSSFQARVNKAIMDVNKPVEMAAKPIQAPIQQEPQTVSKAKKKSQE